MFASPSSRGAQLQATVLFNYSTDTLLKKLTPNALRALKVQANSKDQRDALVKVQSLPGHRIFLYRDYVKMRPHQRIVLNSRGNDVRLMISAVDKSAEADLL